MKTNSHCRNRYNRPLFAAVCLAAAFSCHAWAETVDIPTSYPSPSGSYVKLVTTGDSGPADTTLNRNDGDTVLVPPSNTDGKVGIGVAVTAKKLAIGGDIAVSGVMASETDVKLGANSVITSIVCGPGLECSRDGNTLKVSRVNAGSCLAQCVFNGGSAYYCCYPGEECAIRSGSSARVPGPVDSGPGSVGSVFTTSRTAPAINLNNIGILGSPCNVGTYVCSCTRR